MKGVFVFQITKEFSFSAAHHLLGLPDDHPCGRLHGHNYVVKLVLRSTTEGVLGHENHWVRDYGDLSVVGGFLDREWDHRDLNEWFAANGHGDRGTTAEMIAYVLFTKFRNELPELAEVHVSETPKTWACYGEK